MKRFFRFLLLLLAVLVVAYLLGPKPPKPVLNNDLPSVGTSPTVLEEEIARRESLEKLKPDNQSRFLWANDSLKERTGYALLYLHGFSASWYEGYPVNSDFARRYGCNAYFPRLASHGVDTTEALADMTPDRLWESAKEALMIARKIGKKVIVMGTSTGGTLALKLAAEFPEYVDALILLSPNVRINNSSAFLLSRPWGLQVARAFYKSKYRVTNEDFASKECSYWNCKYRLEAVVYLQQLVEATMQRETFGRVNAPLFLGYYYKDEQNQDQVVRVDAARKMFTQLGTPATLKVEQAFSEAGTHVIGCELFSGAVSEVRQSVFRFAEEKLGLQPVQ